MKLFGFEISIRKAVPEGLQSVYSNSNSWLNYWRPIHEPFAGAWQKNVTADPPTNLMANSTLYACVTGIARDIAKLRIKLSQNEGGVWTEITSGSPWLSVLRKPNHYQNRIKFIEQWILSKLLSGNTYVLKERDQRGVVSRLYILNPQRVKAMVAEDGSVWYQLQTDHLSQLEETVTVPASEMIHDVMAGLWHPLVGISPITACAISATQSNRIQANSTNLFANASRPGGMLLVPGHISDEQAARLKAAFEAGFSGANVGRIAVLGDGMKFEPMVLTADQSQLVQQLKFVQEDICAAFHYPVWKITGVFPPYSSGPHAITMLYYNDCLHPLIEDFELCMEEGLELPQALNYGTELDIENLLRMDTAALYESNGKAVGGGWMSPDEARFRANLKPVPGGELPFLQQQNWQLPQLANRTGPVDSAAVAAPPPPPPRGLLAEDLEIYEAELRKELVPA